jgi:hypothetical protein
MLSGSPSNSDIRIRIQALPFPTPSRVRFVIKQIVSWSSTSRVETLSRFHRLFKKTKRFLSSVPNGNYCWDRNKKQ